MIQFDTPYYLLLMPVALGAAIWTARHGRRFALALRCVVLLLLFFSMAGVRTRSRSDETATVFALDMSAGFAGNKESALAFIEAAQRHKKPEDAVGLVAFGENSVTATPLSKDGIAVDTIDAYVKDGNTDIASALAVSGGIVPDQWHKRVVLISDGLETTGQAGTAAQQLRRRGVAVSTYYIGNTVARETQLFGLTVPRTLSKGMAYDIEAAVFSLTETETRLLIYKNNRLITDETVLLRRGDNRFVFPDTANGADGAQTYRAEIRPANADTFHENNTFYAHSFVSGAPSVLVVGGDSGAEEAAAILRAAGVTVMAISPAEAPRTPDGLNRYQAVVVVNTAADAFPEGFAEALETYVRGTGGGLLVTGGENAYALGGYTDTPWADVLPVDMTLRDESDAPDLGMVIVLDRSGSMIGGDYGVSKLALAKEAVIRSIQVLREGTDTLGVLAFDDGYNWTVETGLLAEGGGAAAVDSVAHIAGGGGTSILPALEEAYDKLKATNAGIKHIILLTDGQAEQTGYDALVTAMRNEGVTLSTVAVGADADRDLLTRLAGEGNGRYYSTDEFTDLPQIFTKETMLAGKTYLNNRVFVPGVVSNHPILSNITALPPLSGYVATTAKTRADVLLASDKDDPILAAWQYGLGKSVAFTSDINHQWSADWLASENGLAVLRNAVSFVLRTETDTAADITVTRRGNDAEVLLTLPFSDGVRSVGGTVSDSQNKTAPLSFENIARGVFRAVLADAAPGLYTARLAAEQDDAAQQGQQEKSMTLGIHIPYAKEYDIRGAQTANGALLMRQIAGEGGGRVLTAAADVFAPFADTDDAYREADWTAFLLLSALLFFLLDVAVRRFPGLTEAAAKATFFVRATLSKRLGSLFAKGDTSPRLKKTAQNADIPLSESDAGQAVFIGEPAATTKGDAHQDGKDAASAKSTSDAVLARLRKRKGG